MPRQSRSRPAARPAPAPAPQKQQTRGAHTAAAPPAHQPAPHAQVPVQHAPASGGGGMFANMASTAAGVAVGSTMGHGLSNMLFGGRSSEAAAAPEPVQQSFEERRMGGQCDVQAKDFTSCLNATGNDMTACSYYLDMLKQCQAAAAPY
ncbi:hypothetical protein ACM66B_003856 [Microbotryomycetes sp. NB124-2]